MFSRYRVSVWDDEKVLERESNDGCTIPMNCTLKNGYNGKFYIFYYNNKKILRKKLPAWGNKNSHKWVNPALTFQR